MQALWSRAGLAHHSGCKAGFNAAGGMMRQSATRATRRKPTFGEIFTACYTSIMGTAAMLDARAKDRRRLDLERQLEDARAELEGIRQQAKTVKNPLPDADTTPSPSASWSPWPLSSTQPLSSMSPHPGSIETPYHGPLRHHCKQSAEISSFLDSLSSDDDWAKSPPRCHEIEFWRKTFGLPLWKSINVRALPDHEALLELIMEDELKSQEKHIAYRTPKTMKQLRMAGLNTAKLIYEILASAESILEPDALQTLRSDVEKLRSMALPRYDVAKSIEDIESCSKQLNKTLADILLDKENETGKKINRVCYNLLVSPYPLTIFTINLLIAGFNHLKLNKQAQCVVNSFFLSKLEPTQRTLVCLLNHYNEGGDREGFYGFIMRMTGKDPKGIKIRRKLVSNVLWHRQLFRWAMTKNVAVTNSYIIERAWFDVDIFTTMIKGMLRFDLLGHAVATFALALEYGVVFGARLVKMLLESSIISMDTECARQMLLALQFRDTLFRDTFSQEEDQVYLARRIQDLIDVCLLDHSPFHVMPWLEVPASILPPEEKRRALRLLSIAQQLRLSHDKCLENENSLRDILGEYNMPKFDQPEPRDRIAAFERIRTLNPRIGEPLLNTKRWEPIERTYRYWHLSNRKLARFREDEIRRLRDKNSGTRVPPPPAADLEQIHKLANCSISSIFRDRKKKREN